MWGTPTQCPLVNLRAGSVQAGGEFVCAIGNLFTLFSTDLKLTLRRRGFGRR